MIRKEKVQAIRGFEWNGRWINNGMCKRQFKNAIGEKDPIDHEVANYYLVEAPTWMNKEEAEDYIAEVKEWYEPYLDEEEKTPEVEQWYKDNKKYIKLFQKL